MTETTVYTSGEAGLSYDHRKWRNQACQHHISVLEPRQRGPSGGADGWQVRVLFALAGYHLPRMRCVSVRRAIIMEIEVLAVKVGRDVPGLFAPLDFAVKRLKHPLFDLLAAVGVDRVGDVRVQLQPRIPVPVAVLQISVFVEAISAVIAIAGTQMVLFSAREAVVGE